MKSLLNSYLKPTVLFGLMFLIVLDACKDEEDGFPITNDLRVLKVNVDGDRLDDGASDVSVISTVELTFSHALNKTAFEQALTIDPNVTLNFSYDATGSIVTVEPNPRLNYDTDYTISLPVGTYGANGEKSTEDFTYNLSSKAFVAPQITLTSSAVKFFEGETVTVTASIPEAIFNDVTFDLVFGGTAVAEDFISSMTSITIPAGQTSANFTVTGVEFDAIEGEETIIITLNNVVNGTGTGVELTLQLGDKAPALELKGVMELDDYIDGTGGLVRAIHLTVLKDIEDLSIYHIQIASNGAAPDPLDIDFVFPAQPASAGDELFVVRDLDAANAATYFGSNYSVFTEFQSTGMTHNGDDAILLYENGVSIESFGEPGVDGTGLFWEYTNSWAYKMGENWYYAGVGCPENAVGAATDETSRCRYPLFSPGLEFKGIMDLNHNGGTNLRAYHVFALKDIPDLSIYGAGIASNGQATSDGVEIPFTNISVKAGEHILVIREADVPNAQAYFEGCYGKFDHYVVAPGTILSSNGDDTIELFKNNVLIETYGELGVDGTGMLWEYDDTWAYKASGVWTTGGVGCSTSATTNASSSCPYPFCN